MRRLVKLQKRNVPVAGKRPELRGKAGADILPDSRWGAGRSGIEPSVPTLIRSSLKPNGQPLRVKGDALERCCCAAAASVRPAILPPDEPARITRGQVPSYPKRELVGLTNLAAHRSMTKSPAREGYRGFLLRHMPCNNRRWTWRSREHPNPRSLRLRTWAHP